jgi:hypothetical protein
MQLLLKLWIYVHNNWCDPIIEDDSWFYYEYVQDRIWIAWADNTPEVENRIIPPRKGMPIVFWNSHDSML